MDDIPVETNAAFPAASRILAVTEEELQRIILDMHDGPVQQLFAAQSQLSSLQARAHRGETIPASEYDLTVSRVSKLVNAALNEIRIFLGTFRPPDFARRSINEILRGLFIHHEMTTGCEVEFEEETTAVAGATAVAIPLPIKIALYRICQEALSNAYRHAHARRQRVRLWQTAVLN